MLVCLILRALPRLIDLLSNSYLKYKKGNLLEAETSLVVEKTQWLSMIRENLISVQGYSSLPNDQQNAIADVMMDSLQKTKSLNRAVSFYEKNVMDVHLSIKKGNKPTSDD